MGNVLVSWHEAAWMRRRLKELGLTWRQALYRGLGTRREEYLATRAPTRKSR